MLLEVGMGISGIMLVTGGEAQQPVEAEESGSGHECDNQWQKQIERIVFVG